MENQPISMHQSNFTVSDSVKKVNEDLYNSPGIDILSYYFKDIDKIILNLIIHK